MNKSRVAGALVVVSLLYAVPASSADRVFDPNVLHETRIVMDPADWQALRDNFRTNQYYAANLSIDGEVLLQIGIRSRGQGSRSGVKPALKLDMNKYVSGQRFHGLKSIAAKNLVQDVSMVRDYLAMSVFEAMGLAAPAYSFTRLTVNDEYWGVYNLVESVEEPFLRARFGEDGGNLFKFEYSNPYYFTDRGTDPAAYIPDPFKPETNENSYDGGALVSLIQAATQAPDETLVTELSHYIDVTRFLTYLGVENALAETDGFLGKQGMNNFYLYQMNGTTRFVIIPWDKNTSFAAAQWNVLNNAEQNVLARRLLALPDQREIYLAAVRTAVNQYVNLTFLGPRLEGAYALVRNAVLADPKKPFTNEEFELGIGGLRGVIGARQDDVIAQAP
jgi:spore coat protein CotH